MKYQVSAADYAGCVADGACEAPEGGRSADGGMPVTGVSYRDAIAYAAWLSAKTGETWRLPSDEEWAFAAAERMNDDALGLEQDGANPAARWLARYRAEAGAGERDAEPRPLGHFGLNGKGLADVAGNVWEWTTTCYVRATMKADGQCGAERGELRRACGGRAGTAATCRTSSATARAAAARPASRRTISASASPRGSSLLAAFKALLARTVRLTGGSNLRLPIIGCRAGLARPALRAILAGRSRTGRRSPARAKPSMELDPLLLSRLQFVWVVGWHILMPAFTVGLGLLYRTAGGHAFLHRREIYFRISGLWIKVFSVASAWALSRASACPSSSAQLEPLFRRHGERAVAAVRL